MFGENLIRRKYKRNSITINEISINKPQRINFRIEIHFSFIDIEIVFYLNGKKTAHCKRGVGSALN